MLQHIKLLIIFGGASPEHAISVRSVKNILKAIDRERYDITTIGISEKGHWRRMGEREIQSIENVPDIPPFLTVQLGEGGGIVHQEKLLNNFDVVFPVVHGPNGEDGTLQGTLTLMNLPYVGAKVLGMAVTMDKDTTKRLLQNEGIEVVKSITLHKALPIPHYEEVSKMLGNPFFVKPSNMGSSIGVHQVKDEQEWMEGIQDAFFYDDKVLVEQKIEGRELECAVLGNMQPEASSVGEIISEEGFYDFNEKYSDSSSASVVIPAQLIPSVEKKIREIAIRSHQTLNCKGLSRVDFFLTKEGTIYVNEVNALPGFTDISMYPQLWKDVGVSYTELIDKLITLALEE